MEYTKAHSKQNSAETSSYFTQNSLQYTSDKYWTLLPSVQVSFKGISCNLNCFIGIPTWMRCQIKRHSELNHRHHHSFICTIWGKQNLWSVVDRLRWKAHFQLVHLCTFHAEYYIEIGNMQLMFSLCNTEEISTRCSFVIEFIIPNLYLFSVHVVTFIPFIFTNACTLIENTFTTYTQITVLKVCDVFQINKTIKTNKNR
jgi:hypothetical protein